MRGEEAYRMEVWRYQTSNAKLIENSKSQMKMQMKMKTLWAQGKEHLVTVCLRVLRTTLKGELYLRLMDWNENMKQNGRARSSQHLGFRMLYQTFTRMLRGEVAMRLYIWNQAARDEQLEKVQNHQLLSQKKNEELEEQLETVIASLMNMSKSEADREKSEADREKSEADREKKSEADREKSEADREAKNSEQNRMLQTQLDAALDVQLKSSEALALWEAAWAKEKDGIMDELENRAREEIREKETYMRKCREEAEAWKKEKVVLEDAL